MRFRKSSVQYSDHWIHHHLGTDVRTLSSRRMNPNSLHTTGSMRKGSGDVRAEYFLELTDL